MITIRTLQKSEDFNDLIALSISFFKEYEAHHRDFFEIDTLNEDDIRDYLLGSIDDSNSSTFIAVSNNSVVAYITVHVRLQPSFWKIKRVGHISGLMIHTDYRRKGIASELLSQARDFFKGKRVKYFTVYTAVRNQSAIDFYMQHGLETLHTTMIGIVEDGS